MIKRSILIVLALAVLCAFCGCRENTEAPYTEITPIPEEQTAAPTEESTPKPTETVYEKRSVELKVGKKEQVNGYTVSIKLATGSISAVVKAEINGTTYRITEGDLEKAYLCGFEDGQTGLVIATAIEERNVVGFYLITEDGVGMVSEMMGSLLSLNEDILKISSLVDVLGTWAASREYVLVEGMKIISEENTHWKISAHDDRNMTALCDIKAVSTETGRDTYILSGSVVTLYSTDCESVAVLKDVSTENLYSVEIEWDGIGGFIVAGNLAEETCLSNIRYSG